MDWSVAISIIMYAVPAERSIATSSSQQVDIFNFTYELFDGHRPRGVQVAAGAVAILLAWCHFLLYLRRYKYDLYRSGIIHVLVCLPFIFKSLKCDITIPSILYLEGYAYNKFKRYIIIDPYILLYFVSHTLITFSSQFRTNSA